MPGLPPLFAQHRRGVIPSLRRSQAHMQPEGGMTCDQSKLKQGTTTHFTFQRVILCAILTRFCIQAEEVLCLFENFESIILHICTWSLYIYIYYIHYTDIRAKARSSIRYTFAVCIYPKGLEHLFIYWRMHVFASDFCVPACDTNNVYYAWG
jgi:hypothetical protein